MKNKQETPVVESRLRHNILHAPKAIYSATGILVYGRRIKSLIFTTDISIIRNCDADAVLALYPFTPQQIISETIIKATDVPVFCGVGGNITDGSRIVNIAKDAEMSGAMGVAVNAFVSDEIVKNIADEIDAPVIVTVLDENTDIGSKLDAGAAILNVMGGNNTPKIVHKIREKFPDVPIIACCESSDEVIENTIEAGANAIAFVSPTSKELFSTIMEKYRGRK
ncbi:MAG: hydrolase [Oscillospiraceae bacterium]|nr:hydrolase [Oscillospiraceae bacterium]